MDGDGDGDGDWDVEIVSALAEALGREDVNEAIGEVSPDRGAVLDNADVSFCSWATSTSSNSVLGVDGPPLTALFGEPGSAAGGPAGQRDAGGQGCGGEIESGGAEVDEGGRAALSLSGRSYWFGISTWMLRRWCYRLVFMLNLKQ